MGSSPTRVARFAAATGRGVPRPGNGEVQLLPVEPFEEFWHVVQLVGRLTVNEEGAGSSPAVPAKFRWKEKWNGSFERWMSAGRARQLRMQRAVNEFGPVAQLEQSVPLRTERSGVRVPPGPPD